MQFTLLSRKTLKDIPSASGIEIIGEDIYVMGDDSPWLFKLNAKFEVQEKIPIGDIDAAVKGKIPKPIKPDLEAMTSFGDELLLFGSGSKSPQRDVLVRVNITSKIVSRHSLVQFYDSLCAAAKITPTDLNLEGAVVVQEKLLLFNRGNNFIFRIAVKEFLEHVEGNNPIPAVDIYRATLPSLNGMEAGFSGAALTPDKDQIAFCASLENTANWIDDGEILGSFVGIFSPEELKSSFAPTCIAITDKEKNILKIKVESVAVKSINEKGLLLWLVTDTDGTASEVLEAELVV